MKSENKRIFISDLPETSTKDELESSFSKYGQVSSVEIKERKELGPNNKSLFFAYINLITNDKDLNHCFQDLSNTKWHGQYVQLQIARENFLERLKRERREAEVESIENDVKPTISRNFVENTDRTVSNGVRASQKDEPSSDSETDSSESDSDVKLKTKPNPIALPTKSREQEPALSDSINEDIGFKTHSNKNKLPLKGGLKIPSVGNAPIAEINLKNNKTKPNDNAANMKRLQSLRDMKKGYAAQKSLIKNALQYGVAKPNNKIRFDDGSDNANKQAKINGFKDSSLFGEDNSEDDFEVNFDVKEQFQGKSGQKLLELQSRYKNDKRFNLDQRFIEPEVDDEEKSEDNLEAEKNEQLKILEEVLGKKITSKSASKKDNAVRKRMVKFDPSQPDHSNFEFTASEPEEKKRKKEKTKYDEPAEPEKPQVSKEVFFKVAENLKEALSEKPQLNLLSMFGRTEHEDVKVEVQTEKALKRNPLFGDRNPFKYDSSDEEDEIEDIPHKDTSKKSSEAKKNEPSAARSNQSVFWTEPFFFKGDDFRLQEGQDFVEKIKSEDKEFLKIRRELKGIVRAKVRNNERKIKMFKKKLGGSKKRKHIRIKKALKR